MKKRYVIRKLPDGWYVYDKKISDCIEGYGSDRNRAYIAACYHNYRLTHPAEQHPYR